LNCNIYKPGLSFGIFILFIFGLSAQELPDFRSPIDHSIRLSGSFGELRSNHFHAGIDLKSLKGISGDPLYSISEGYIYRVMLHPTGYGNALIIRHDNGYTSVYAHMDRFEINLGIKILAAQYETKSYVMDYYPGPDAWRVSKGQLIGYMGNTGYSFGPHLHFEIRRTEDDMLFNPLMFGYEIVDNVPPVMDVFRWYALDLKLIKKNGGYAPVKDTLLIPGDYAALSLSTIDFMTGVANRNGVYKLELYVDDTLRFHYQMDSFLRKDTRYLNAHTDYNEYFYNKKYFHRLHRLPGNNINLYPFLRDDGVFPVDSGSFRTVKMISYDYQNNNSIATMLVGRDTATALFKPPKHTHVLEPNTPYHYLFPGCELIIPENMYYERTYMQLSSQVEKTHNAQSHALVILNGREPLHGFYEMSFEAGHIPDSLRAKAFIGSRNGNSITNYGGEWAGDTIFTKARSNGRFAVYLDTVPPKIKAVKFQAGKSKLQNFSFNFSDNFARAGDAEKRQIDVFLNGAWFLAKYNGKSNNISVPLVTIPKGKNHLKIDITDSMGNVGTWESEFTR
jgi:murein DD-endopeptidase MepM/ murein hydrolase activator NlpD